MIRITEALGEMFPLPPNDNFPERMPRQPSDWGIFFPRKYPRPPSPQNNLISTGREWNGVI
jgi:hypothetical protein